MRVLAIFVVMLMFLGCGEVSPSQSQVPHRNLTSDLHSLKRQLKTIDGVSGALLEIGEDDDNYLGVHTQVAGNASPETWREVVQLDYRYATESSLSGHIVEFTVNGSHRYLTMELDGREPWSTKAAEVLGDGALATAQFPVVAQSAVMAEAFADGDGTTVAVSLRLAEKAKEADVEAAWRQLTPGFSPAAHVTFGVDNGDFLTLRRTGLVGYGDVATQEDFELWRELTSAMQGHGSVYLGAPEPAFDAVKITLDYRGKYSAHRKDVRRFAALAWGIMANHPRRAQLIVESNGFDRVRVDTRGCAPTDPRVIDEIDKQVWHENDDDTESWGGVCSVD